MTAFDGYELHLPSQRTIILSKFENFSAALKTVRCLDVSARVCIEAVLIKFKTDDIVLNIHQNSKKVGNFFYHQYAKEMDTRYHCMLVILALKLELHILPENSK